MKNYQCISTENPPHAHYLLDAGYKEPCLSESVLIHHFILPGSTDTYKQILYLIVIDSQCLSTFPYIFNRGIISYVFNIIIHSTCK